MPQHSWLFVPSDAAPLPAADFEWSFGGASPAGWTHTRAGPALGRGPDGRWTEYPADAPRPYHHPVTLTNLGTLIEPSRSQLLYKSRPVNVVPTQSAMTTDAAVQTPLGVGGVALVPNATLTTHGFDLFFNTVRAAPIPDNANVAIQLVFKMFGGLTRGSLILQQKSGAYKFIDFTTDGGGAILANAAQWARITPDTDGFFRLEAGMNYGTGTGGGAANFNFRNAAGNRTFSGDGVGGMTVAYFGAELGLETTSPIVANGTTTIARPEDVVQAGAEWMLNGEKSFGIQYTPFGVDPQIILHASGSDTIELRTEPNLVAYSVLSQGSSVGFLTGAAPAATVERTTVVTAGFNVFWLIQDGKKLKVDEDGTPPKEIDAVRLGARVGGAFAGPVVVRRVKYWAQALDREAAVEFSRDLSLPGVAPIKPVIDIQSSRTVGAAENTFALTVTLTGEPAGAATSYRMTDGTAKAGVDYVADAGKLTFAPGQSAASLTVNLGQRSLEQDRSFSIELYAPVGAVLGVAVCVVTLTKASPTAHAPTKSARFNAALSADWALTRNTAGYARDADGVWKSVAAGQPRIHYLAAGEAGLLLEPASEQRIFDSVTSFYLSNSTRTTDTTTVTPTGSRSSVWRETATTAAHLLRGSWTSAGADWPTGDVTVWAIVKPVGARTVYRFSVKGIDNVWKQTRFDFSGNGSVVAVPADVIARIEPEPMWPGWYRLGISRAQGASAGVPAEFDLGPVDANNSNVLAGDVNNGFNLCHFQVEPGLIWTSPIPVQAAAAKTVRAADVLKAAGGWQNRNSFALGVKFKRLDRQPASQRIVQFRDADPIVDDFGVLTADAVIRAPLTTGGVVRGTIDGPANVLGDYATAVVSIDASRYALFVGGVKSGEIAMPGKTMPELVEHLRFGSNEPDGSQAAPIVLHSAAYWTVGLSDEEGNVFSADLSGTPPGTVEPDPLPTVSIPATLLIKEGSILEVPISKVGNGACSVSFTTKSQTASYNVDYMGVGPITVSFAANESVKTVQVTTLADALADPDEKFGISISSPTGCVLGNAVGVVTITENPRLSVPTSLSVQEGGVASVIITKVGAGACSVSWRTKAVTASLNVDYLGQNATVINFSANETSKTVTVQTSSDAVVEQPETFQVLLESPVDCSITTGTCVVSIIDPAAPPPPQTAYTPADGFASAADCGLGKTVYRVTNLNDTGDGSLRKGVEAGDCMIVFEVGGTINLGSRLVFGGNLTVAGETAPAPGITIAKDEFLIQKSNVRISHVTFEKGYDGDNLSNSDVGKIGQGSPTVPTTGAVTTQNVHFSHCAFYWNLDESIEHWPSKSRRLVNISYHDCIFTEPLYKPSDYDSTLKNHIKLYEPYNQSNHNYCVLVGYNSRKIDFQYCMFSENSRRSPFIDHSTEVVVGNCISLNGRTGVTIEQNPGPDGNGKPLPDSYNYQVTVRGYLVISGPDSGTAAFSGFRFHSYVNPQPAGSKVCVTDLYGWKGGTSSSSYSTPGTEVTYNSTQGKPYWLDGTKQINVEVSDPPVDAPTPISPLTAQEIYDRAVMNIGPRPKEIRALIDGTATVGNKDVKRTIESLKSKTGGWVNHENEVGGFYSPTKTSRALTSTAKFDDGTLIGDVPDQPQPSTATSRSNMKAWLRKHLDRVQYD